METTQTKARPPVSESRANSTNVNSNNFTMSAGNPANLLLHRLEGVRPRGHDSWTACCPAHEDHSLSLSIRETSDGTLLIHCFTGCHVDTIAASVGLQVSDLFTPRQQDNYGPRRKARSPAFPWRDTIKTLSRKPVAAATVPSLAALERMQDCIKGLWMKAKRLEDPEAEVGRTYLEYRGLAGLTPLPYDVRLHLRLPYWWQPDLKAKRIELGRWPALVALVRDLSGRVRSLHRTYLQPDDQGKFRVLSPTGEPLSAKKLLALAPGATRGCAIQLYPVTEGRLAVCEGLETGLSIWQAFHWPVWSFLSASGLEHAVIPTEVRTVAIMVDHDANNTGQDAARALARRLVAMAAPPVIRLRVPTRPDSDWLDAVIEGACHG